MEDPDRQTWTSTPMSGSQRSHPSLQATVCVETPVTVLNPPQAAGGMLFNYTGFACGDSEPADTPAASPEPSPSRKSSPPPSILRQSPPPGGSRNPSPAPEAGSPRSGRMVGFAGGSLSAEPNKSPPRRSPRALAAAAGGLTIPLPIPPMQRRGTTTMMRRTSQMLPAGMNTLDEAGDVLLMINVAKRRASRFLGAEALPQPASTFGSPKAAKPPPGLTLEIPPVPDVVSAASPRAASPTQQEELVRLRTELEQSKADVMQMADLGQSLLMDLEDMREKWNEADADREKLERANDDLVTQVHRQQRQCNELKAMNVELRDQLEAEQRKKAEEIAALMDDFHEQLEQAAEQAACGIGGTATDQSIALQQLRRAQLVQSRIESAKAAFRLADANPVHLEASQRQALSEHMLKERCELWSEMASAAHSGWWDVQNDYDLLQLTRNAAQGQIENIIQARLRAEQQASVQASLHSDVCKILSEKELLVQRLQHQLQKYEVTLGVAKADVTPSIHQALLKVRRLNKSFAKTRGLVSSMSPMRGASRAQPCAAHTHRADTASLELSEPSMATEDVGFSPHAHSDLSADAVVGVV
eukprot:TRINITY_DN33155_c0_g1_i1.p1 TRINITY_DN33155_c0_g1~~TRINITY_DN33155_c0_g1_i1.p1  ORF type:complete len:606 (+),score=203.57 TRINITY_DN33155_c0_g1_i1:58-1818(+)